MPEINWTRVGKEIADLRGGIAVLRLLQAHGITHFVKFSPDSSGIKQSCTIEMVVDYAHKER